MKLSDYKLDTIPYNEHIYLPKFEIFFKDISNGKNVVYYPAKWQSMKFDINKVVNSFSNKKGLLLMTNGDCDMPCIQQQWFYQDDLPYSDDLQKSIDNKPIEDFLELDLLNINQDIQVFCNSIIKTNPNFHMIPIGRDPKGSHVNIDFDMPVKDILCYYNCSVPPKSIHWYGRIR